MTMTAPTEIGIACRDIDTLAQFYVCAFGFTFISRIDVAARPLADLPLSDTAYTVVRLQSPFGERLKLLSAHVAYRPSAQQRPARNLLGTANTSFLTVIVADLAATAQQAMRCGATMLGETVRIRPDLDIVFLQDPEGNYLEVAQYGDIRCYRADLQPDGDRREIDEGSASQTSAFFKAPPPPSFP